MEESKLWSQAGISFGEQETYFLQQSLIKLANSVQATELRFWGKYLTRGGKDHKDYYVAEGLINYDHSDDPVGKMERKGEGINKYTFWVTNDVLSDWIELPMISPDQLSIARKIKYICTGNLNNKVTGYPYFDGLEKHFLKAQLVRISFSTGIVPKSLYKLQDENDKEIELEEEFKLQDFAELNNLENWVHKYPHILKEGRIIHYTEGMDEEKKTAVEEADPFVERLRQISEDRLPGTQENPNWIVKTIGDVMTFKTLTRDNKEDERQSCYAFTTLRNLTWQGATTIISNKVYTNIYIGYGLKNRQMIFDPNQPNDIGLESPDLEEHKEPIGKSPEQLAKEEAERKAQEEKEAKENEENQDEEDQ